MRRNVIGLVVLLVTAGLPACAVTEPATVTILGPWLDTGENSEGREFRTVLDAFTEETGIEYDYQQTRALAQVLRSGMASGAPPDVAILSSPGDLARFARGGGLYPLDDVLSQRQRAAYDAPWLLPTRVDGVDHVYTVPIKANLTSLVWYNPKRLTGPPPGTLEELLAFGGSAAGSGITPWCMGMGDSSISGWSGADLIEDIFVHRFGPDRYRQWAAGDLAWTSEQVRQAWAEWGSLATDPRAVYGGPRTVFSTDFGDSGLPLFTDPPGCLFEHQSSFIMGFYRDFESRPTAGEDFDFFPFPGAVGTDPVWTVSVDLAGMFTDTPQARSLMEFLARDSTQGIWPRGSDRGVFTLNRDVDTDVYQDPISPRIAEVFSSDDPLCFHVVDILPPAVRTAYYRAVLEYLNSPARLDELLAGLDEVRAAVPPEEWLDLPCTA
ncbi:ABC transporter substrate-binding protein [Actinophytocola xinjiangensis]|uniref:ABC transporter substrate-binding protein n=1 Tax=Actinophytocola xinjiangensis TaxID=485602 RepID=UPI000A6D523B|nr:ABC transporter substrate-binding protein [Actinophytocola xinjiangensis]